MVASRREFLAGFGSLLAAPAIVRADSLMHVRSIVKPYATVWGVGWDLEVVEHVVWTPKDALMFAQHWDSGLGKFREVTEVVYTKPISLPYPTPTQMPQGLIPANPMDRFAAMQRGKWKMVPMPSPEYPHAVRYEPVTVFDDAKEMKGKHPYVRKLNLEAHWGDRHAEHLAELSEANKTRNDDLEIEGKHQHMIDVAHNYELSTGNSDKWDYNRWEAFRDANKFTDPLPKVKFKVAVKSIV
jgi:hypothetical protein